MGDNNKQQAENKPNPADFFRNTSHDVINQDASFHLLKPGKSKRENMAKTRYIDHDNMIRIIQGFNKLHEYDIDEEAAGKNRDSLSGQGLLDDLLVSLPSIRGFARIEFNMSHSGLFAPSVVEFPETGKMPGDGKSSKRFGVFKAREQKEPEEKEQ